MPPSSRRLATLFALTLLAAPPAAAGGIVAHVRDEPRAPAPDTDTLEHLLAAGERAEKDEDYAAAETAYRDALKIARELPRRDPRRVEALEALADLYDSRLGRKLDAGPLWQEAWELRLKAGTAADRKAWSTRWHLAQFYTASHDWARLEAFRRLWVELVAEAEWADDDDLSDALRDLASTVERRRPDDPEVVDLLERALGLAGDGDDRRNLSRKVARLQVARQRADEALELLREAAWRAETEPIFDSQEVSRLYDELGEAAVEAGRLDLAESAFRSALAAKTRRLGAGHAHLNGYRQDLIDLLAGQGRWAEARAELEAAHAAAARTWGEHSPAAAGYRQSLAELDRRAAGESAADDSLAVCTCICRDLPAELEALRDAGRAEDAIARAGQLVAAAEAEAGAASQAVADALADQLTLLDGLDREAAADVAARRFEVLWELAGPGDPEVSYAADRAARLASAQKRTDEALRFAEAQLLSRRAAGVVTADLGEALVDLARLQSGDEQVASYAEAVEVYAATWGEGSPQHTDARRYLVESLTRAGRAAEAEERAQELVADLEPRALADRWNLIDLDYALAALRRALAAGGQDAAAAEVEERRQALPHYDR